MKDIEKAKILLKDDKTLILVKDDEVISSNQNGIKPLINLLNKNIDLKGYSLADKIIGKAQAMLIVKANIKNVYAKVLSKQGEQILIDNNVSYCYDTLTEQIINRNKTDICPMEKAVKDIFDIEKAYITLKQLINKLG